MILQKILITECMYPTFHRFGASCAHRLKAQPAQSPYPDHHPFKWLGPYFCGVG